MIARRETANLHATNPHAGTGEGTESRLGTGTRGLRSDSTSGADLDVKGSDADLAAADGDVLGSKHGGVGRRLIAIGLDLHSTWRYDKETSALELRLEVGPVARRRLEWRQSGCRRRRNGEGRITDRSTPLQRLWGEVRIPKSGSISPSEYVRLESTCRAP